MKEKFESKIECFGQIHFSTLKGYEILSKFTLKPPNAGNEVQAP